MEHEIGMEYGLRPLGGDAEKEKALRLIGGPSAYQIRNTF